MRESGGAWQPESFDYQNLIRLSGPFEDYEQSFVDAMLTPHEFRPYEPEMTPIFEASHPCPQLPQADYIPSAESEMIPNFESQNLHSQSTDTFPHLVGPPPPPPPSPRERYNRPRKYPNKQAKNRTKNLTPFCSSLHCKYLQQHFKVNDITKHPFFRRLFITQRKTKDGSKKLFRRSLNRKDFEMLYNTSWLTHVWEKMFEEEYLYRKLMVARTLSQGKKEYQKYLSVFEQAFKDKVFENIR